MQRRRVRMLMVIGLLASVCLESQAAELLIGGATTNITPDKPVPLSGQMRARIAKKVDSPVTATALALESRQGDKVLEQVIFISCDLVAIREGIADKVRQRLKDRAPDFDVRKLILSATHTHTAPEVREGVYELPRQGIIQPTEYAEFLVDRLAAIAGDAWKGRKSGQVGYGLGHAVVAQIRRAFYANGQAQMYGRTDKPDFRRLQGYEDHGLEVLFFWDKDRRLLATAINVACPAQEVEGLSTVNADFWHEVREALRARHGKDLLVLGWIGAAGDQSPHLMFRKQAEERMRKLRGLTRLQELARRIVVAWDDAYQAAGKEMLADVPLQHHIQTIALPLRVVTKEECAKAQAQVEILSKDPANSARTRWHQRVLERFERQQAGPVPPYEMELHVLRLGDVAIATNDFELFTDFGIQIKSRSRAVQTFILQLSGPGTYVPTPQAARSGGYSAIVESNLVGAEGGQVLVDQTVKAINALWPER